MTKRTFVPLLAIACMMVLPAANTANAPEQKKPDIKTGSAQIMKASKTEVQQVMYRSEKDKLVFKNALFHPEKDKIKIVRPVYKPEIDSLKISDLTHEKIEPVKP